MANAVPQRTSVPDDQSERASGRFEVDVTVEGDVAVAWLSGELDLVSAPRLTRAVEARPPEPGQRLVLDLSNLDFLDAAGLGAIVTTRNALRARSGDLRLRAPSRLTARILEITGLAWLTRWSAPVGHDTDRPACNE